MGAVEEPADLLDHPFFDSGVEASVDSGVAFLAGYQCTYIICILRKEGCALHRVFGFIDCDFECTDQALA